MAISEDDTAEIELTELGKISLENQELQHYDGPLMFGERTAVLELVKRTGGVFPKCPVCQVALDGSVRTVECLVDKTAYCVSCAEGLAQDRNRCWICDLVGFSEILEAEEDEQ